MPSFSCLHRLEPTGYAWRDLSYRAKKISNYEKDRIGGDHRLLRRVYFNDTIISLDLFLLNPRIVYRMTINPMELLIPLGFGPTRPTSSGFPRGGSGSSINPCSSQPFEPSPFILLSQIIDKALFSLVALLSFSIRGERFTQRIFIWIQNE